jgi:Protein of unknown function (DUF2786)
MPIEREKLLHKVRALLAKTLANGCTEQEASAALVKAQAMIDAYEISGDELNLTKQQKAILFAIGTRDPHGIKRFLSYAIARYTKTEAWISSRNGLSYCGLKTDVDFATWLTDSLANFVQTTLAGYLAQTPHQKGKRRALINGFVIGCTARISERL